jgi:hypothetical protein
LETQPVEETVEPVELGGLARGPLVHLRGGRVVAGVSLPNSFIQTYSGELPFEFVPP